MEGFDLSIMINRPIEEVFGFLANFENNLKWRSEWVEAKNTSDVLFPHWEEILSGLTVG
jgi:hypothetical protein